MGAIRQSLIGNAKKPERVSGHRKLRKFPKSPIKSGIASKKALMIQGFSTSPKKPLLRGLVHLLDFDKIVSELGVINQTDACVVLKRNQEAVG